MQLPVPALFPVGPGSISGHFLVAFGLPGLLHRRIPDAGSQQESDQNKEYYFFHKMRFFLKQSVLRVYRTHGRVPEVNAFSGAEFREEPRFSQLKYGRP
jgi:hypothetical protein